MPKTIKKMSKEQQEAIQWIEQRSERLAINVDDLDRLDDHTKLKLVAHLEVTPQEYLKIDKDRAEPEAALAFDCQLLQAALMCDMLRHYDRKAGDKPTRVYAFKAKVWTRVPTNVTLTRVRHEGAKPELNPLFWDVKIEPIKAEMPEPEAVDLLELLKGT